MQNFMCLDELGDKSDLPLHFPFLQSAVSSPPSLLVHVVSLSRRAVAFSQKSGVCNAGHETSRDRSVQNRPTSLDDSSLKNIGPQKLLILWTD